MTEPASWDRDPLTGGMVPRVDTLQLVADMLERANECDRFIEKQHVAAAAALTRAMEAMRNAITHGQLTQPGVVSAERWEARTVKCAPNCVAYNLVIPGGGWSLHGDACRRMSEARDACEAAHRATLAVGRETRYVRCEADVLRRLASDIRMGRLGMKRNVEEADGA